MTLEAQVKVFPADLASFGGVRLRRLAVRVGAQTHQLLLHEQGRTGAFVVSGEGAGPIPFAGELVMKAEWGEPLGNVVALATNHASGEVRAYTLALKTRSGEVLEVDVEADHAFWWNGELCCNKRVAYQLRDLQRGRRAQPGRARQSAA